MKKDKKKRIYFYREGNNFIVNEDGFLTPLYNGIGTIAAAKEYLQYYNPAAWVIYLR